MKPHLQQVPVPPAVLSMHWQQSQRKLTVFVRQCLIAEVLLAVRQGMRGLWIICSCAGLPKVQGGITLNTLPSV